MVLYIDPIKEVTAMSEIVIETKQLTKQYGTQKSVAELNIHVQEAASMVCWAETEPEKPPP